MGIYFAGHTINSMILIINLLDMIESRWANVFVFVDLSAV